MDYKLINKALDEISSTYPGSTDNLKSCDFIQKITDHTGLREDDDGYQGEYNSYFKIYKIKNTDLYIKLEYRTDSYGDNDSLYSLNFVKPVTKEVTSYEPI